MLRSATVVAIFALGLGCGGVHHEPPGATPASDRLGEAEIARWNPTPPASEAYAYPPPAAPTRSGEAVLPRPRSGRRITVRFSRSSLENAIRLLADEARVSVVIARPLAGELSLRLSRVDPLEAIYALAHAHGATVERQGPILIVR
ncbi:MAG: hypothetical protein AAGF12_08240 [Myxococcota bacterium]